MTQNRKPDPFAAADESAQLIAQARQLDTRLRSVTQTDRQLTRRAASHLSQLARRLSVLLSRTTTALPMIPVAGAGRRLNHYVLHAERQSGDENGAGSVRMLTIGSNGMLRTGSTDLDGTSFVWVEYDPFSPAEGWEVEVVLQWLADALQRMEGQVEAIETRTRERTETLNALVSSSKRPTPSAPETTRTPHPFAPMPAASRSPLAEPAPSRQTTPSHVSPFAPSQPTHVSHAEAAVARLNDTPPVDAMEELARAEEDEIESAEPESMEDAATRHRRELFKRIR